MYKLAPVVGLFLRALFELVALDQMNMNGIIIGDISPLLQIIPPSKIKEFSVTSLDGSSFFLIARLI